MKNSSNNTGAITAAIVILAVMLGGIVLCVNASTNMSGSVKSSVEKTSFSGTRIETETQTIPYETQTVDDNTIEYGDSKVRTAGVNGEKTLKYEVTYENDEVVSKELKSEEITTQPITEVIARGTKVIWHCVDVTSYDRNPNNDNKCTSSTGEVRYVNDCQAEALDPNYEAGKAGAAYYNRC